MAAGFNAPVAGIFFALEVVAAAVRAAVPEGEAVPGELDLPDAVAAASLSMMVEGHQDNIKITLPQDLALASLYLEQQSRGQ